MLRIDPALPMLRMLPALPMLKTLPMLPMLKMLPALRRLRMLSALITLSTLPTLPLLNRLPRPRPPRAQGGRTTRRRAKAPPRPRQEVIVGRGENGRDRCMTLSFLLEAPCLPHRA